MFNPLPENVVRAVIREVLAAKSPILNMILEELTLQLTPIVAEQAKTMLRMSFAPDPRDEMISMLITELKTTVKIHEWILYEGPTEETRQRAEAEFDEARIRYDGLIKYCENSQSERDAGGPCSQIAEAVKGGRS